MSRRPHERSHAREGRAAADSLTVTGSPLPIAARETGCARPPPHSSPTHPQVPTTNRFKDAALNQACCARPSRLSADPPALTSPRRAVPRSTKPTPSTHGRLSASSRSPPSSAWWRPPLSLSLSLLISLSPSPSPSLAQPRAAPRGRCCRQAGSVRFLDPLTGYRFSQKETQTLLCAPPTGFP